MTQQSTEGEGKEVIHAEAVPAESGNTAVAAPSGATSVFDIAPAEFNAQLDNRKKNRASLIQWIKDHLKPDLDYHTIQNRKFIGKAGAEKIGSLLGLVARYPKFADYQQKILDGEPLPEIIVLSCELWSGDKIVAEGIGARQRAHKADSNDPNKSLKMAMKSALCSATLGLGLSELFSQDGEAVQERENNNKPQPAKAAAGKSTKPRTKADEKTIAIAWRCMKRLQDLAERGEIEPVQKGTFNQSDFINGFVEKYAEGYKVKPSEGEMTAANNAWNQFSDISETIAARDKAAKKGGDQPPSEMDDVPF